MIMTAKYKVLVADDSTLVRQHLVAMLSEIEQVKLVAEADDIDATLESVRTLHPDLVVLDIQMPGGNGINALKDIKRDYPETRVIMLTNHTNSFYRDTCMRAGADSFLDKSIEFEQVPKILLQLMTPGQA